MTKLLLPVLFLCACSEGGVLPMPQPEDDARVIEPTPDARPQIDAPPGGSPDAAAGTPDAGTTFPPSTANVGWIGGACSSPSQCMVDDPLCLTDGFPNGMCTKECTGLCPDRTQSRDTVTTCVDGRPFGFDQGLCVSRCDPAVLPPTGCPAGYSCLPKNRYLDASRVIDVCVPTPDRGACDATQDLLIDVNYPQFGKLWIPREAQCGGAFPLLVQLHGINGGMNPTPSIGGGRRMEYLVRSLIDYKVIVPILVAEPVQTNAASASSTGLYAPQYWEPAHHLELLEPHLAQRNITLSSVSYAGHSGAGCDPDNGLYLVLKRYADLVPAHAPVMKLWGLEDVCYGPSYHSSAPIAALGGKDVAIVNVWSGQSGDANQTLFENGLIPDPATMPCSTAVFGKCIRHKVEPWCSYRTKASAMVMHDDNPFFFFREALPQVFPTDTTIRPCR